MNCACIIPAKGNSTRLPKKNLQELGGMTLVERAIICAKNAGIFSDIIVSTNDLEIARIAHSHGVTIRRRPEVLCADGVEWAPVIADALATLDYACGSFCILAPTSPLRTPAQVREAWRMFRMNGAELLSTVDAKGACDGTAVFCQTRRFLADISKFDWTTGYWLTGLGGIDVNTAEDLEKCRALLS